MPLAIGVHVHVVCGNDYYLGPTYICIYIYIYICTAQVQFRKMLSNASGAFQCWRGKGRTLVSSLKQWNCTGAWFMETDNNHLCVGCGMFELGQLYGVALDDIGQLGLGCALMWIQYIGPLDVLLKPDFLSDTGSFRFQDLHGLGAFTAKPLTVQFAYNVWLLRFPIKWSDPK